MTGWGQTGPLAQTVGHDINYIAITGALEKMGRDAGRPVPPLNLVTISAAAVCSWLTAWCALLEAQKSGKGQVVDAAIVDGAATLMAYLYAYRKNPFFMPYKDRGSHLFGGSNHFYNTFECADGKFVSVGALEAHFYLDFIERIGVDKAEFEQQWLGSPEQDVSKIPALEKKVAAAFKTKTRDEWVKIFEGSSACFAPVLDIQEAAQYPHNVERKTFVEVDGLLQHAPAPRFSRSEPATPVAPRVAGEDTDAVLADLGCSASDIAGLREAGVVAG
ncbi:MAG: CaiB/BaiF CoA-transferase family protein [Pseudomonadales bacterium]